MFITKFLENIFSNSLKDKPGPSFAYAYFLSWIICNYEYPLEFLSTQGELATKITAMKGMEDIHPSYWWPVAIALAIVVFKPLLNNIGVLSREGFDKLTQHLLKTLNIKSYRTEKEYKALMVTNEDLLTKNTKYIEEVSASSKVKGELDAKLREAEEELVNLRLENDKFKKDNEQLLADISKLETGIQDCHSEIKMLSNDKSDYESALREKLALIEGLQDDNSSLKGKYEAELEKNKGYKDIGLSTDKLKEDLKHYTEKKELVNSLPPRIRK